ncbi:PREDICTED: spindle pole body component 110-like [Dufourea novaeangliae]|uniref:spindle pole body component 110-like n=1 Tax=Dufourea novaeangliae TaxID=178035 RepID=UPI0007675C8E|nr:PREDICTED: spindle pole body component 110-like [Dufourea novaeangliae]
MCSISARLDILNQQLTSISKLQKMEEEFDMYPHSMCKKCNKQSNFGKFCHCAHHAFSLKEQCNRLNYIQESISCDNAKRRVPCNARTFQTDLMNDEQRSIAVSNVRHNFIFLVPIEILEIQNKSNQVNINFFQRSAHYVNNGKIDTYEEKSKQTVPTKEESFHTVLSKEKVQIEEDTEVIQDSTDLKDADYNIENVPIKDDRMFDRIQKDLLNERKRTRELEKKLKSLTCSINCLKEDSEQKALCLKSALQTAEEQTKLAMDLVKQSTAQADLVKTDKDELSSQISKLHKQIAELTNKNAALTEERDNLKQKLESLSEDETRRCAQVETEVNRIKCAVKEKEDALSKERVEFKSMILELTNVIKIQKRRIYEVTCVCNNQQRILNEKGEELSQKNTELSEIQGMLQSSNSACKEMQEQIEHLNESLSEQTRTCECMKQDLEVLKENHSSELRIKEKIVDEQNKTITRHRKLLYESEKMVQQVASEFDQLKEELCQEKEKCNCLQLKLDKANTRLNKVHPPECEKCKSLRSEIDYLKKEKQRALAIAKFAYQKLNQSVKEYQNQLTHQKEQQRYMQLIIERKEHEIGSLKIQMYQNSSRSIQKVNNYVM